MIQFDTFHLEEGIPIYLQIIAFIKRGIVSGSIQAGELLPSRRNLSALLGVNPNTVQKAYHLLEEEQLIQSQSGAKSTLAFDEAQRSRIRAELLESDIRSVVGALKQAGLTKQEALSLMDKYWN